MKRPYDRLLWQDSMELARCDEAPDEREHTDDDSEESGDQREVDIALCKLEECQSTDECRGTTADTVEQSHHLRHLDHLDSCVE